MNELGDLKDALLAVTEELETVNGFAAIVEHAAKHVDGSIHGRDQLVTLISKHQLAALKFCELAADFLVKANKTSDALRPANEDMPYKGEVDEI